MIFLFDHYHKKCIMPLCTAAIGETTEFHTQFQPTSITNISWHPKTLIISHLSSSHSSIYILEVVTIHLAFPRIAHLTMFDLLISYNHFLYLKLNNWTSTLICTEHMVYMIMCAESRYWVFQNILMKKLYFLWCATHYLGHQPKSVIPSLISVSVWLSSNLSLLGGNPDHL